MLVEGIHSVNPAKPVQVISNEEDAIRFAFENAKPGAFIFICADHPFTTVELVRKAQEAEGEEQPKASMTTFKQTYGTKRNNPDHRGSRG